MFRMDLDMIKPFTINDVTQLDDGTRRVQYTVRKTDRHDNGTKTSTMNAVVFVSPNTDIEMYLFQELQKQGWF